MATIQKDKRMIEIERRNIENNFKKEQARLRYEYYVDLGKTNGNMDKAQKITDAYDQRIEDLKYITQAKLSSLTENTNSSAKKSTDKDPFEKKLEHIVNTLLPKEQKKWFVENAKDPKKKKEVAEFIIGIRKDKDLYSSTSDIKMAISNYLEKSMAENSEKELEDLQPEDPNDFKLSKHLDRKNSNIGGKVGGKEKKNPLMPDELYDAYQSLQNGLKSGKSGLNEAIRNGYSAFQSIENKPIDQIINIPNE